MRVLWSIMITLCSTQMIGQSAERVESEYKLAIPTTQAEALWEYLKSEAFLAPLRTEYDLTTSVSVEEFVDVYFDDEESRLYSQEVGLRYRSRYVGDSLIKQLIQLKTPLAADGVARTETKYEKKNSQDRNDFYARHDLLKLIKKGDRTNLNYLLAGYGTDAQAMRPEVRLRQTRKRIYMADDITSLATITLDEVTNLVFPYQRYTEMELELNEVRYTNADKGEKERMETFNEKLRNGLLTAFPDLKQDQTPKYNKMKEMIDGNIWSTVYRVRMWIVLGVICMVAMISLGKQWSHSQSFI